MRTTQRGITALGWLVLLIPIAIIVYAGIRVLPLYLNYFKVARVVEQTAADLDVAEGTSAGQIRSSLERRLDIESVSFPSANDITVTREGRAWVIRANYEQTAPLFSNISILVSFDRSARAGGG